MTKAETDIIIKLGHGAFFRKIQSNGKGDVELMLVDKSTVPVDFELYHSIRNKGLCGQIAVPAKCAVPNNLFEGNPGEDQFYYYGLNEKGKSLFYEIQKEKS
jgi:hypothetical protein